MLDKTNTRKHSTTESGQVPRHILLDKLAQREAPPKPITLPEFCDEGATTGIMPVVLEGEDYSAQRDDDKGR